MRVLFCGDRFWDDDLPIGLLVSGLRALDDDLDDPVVIIEGGAPGADGTAGQCADLEELAHERYPADWRRFRNGAGPKRNQQMLDEGKPDIVFAFHNCLAESKGTADMVRRARAASIPVYLVSRLA